jgi:altronate dehydratase small subunit
MRELRDPASHALLLHADDDVAVALVDLDAGRQIDVRRGDANVRIETRDRIPLGHKIALRALAAGTPIRKYGEVIGSATAAIDAGAHVHIHNMTSLRARRTR